jgi:Lon protease-like protein
MELGLFPLGMVLLPGELVPLHIFEPRYRELIGECLARDEPFGLVLEDAEGLRRVGTAAMVVEVLERMPDGRLDILVEGGGRFAIVEETAGRSFRTAIVEPVEDTAEAPAPEELERCLTAFRALAREAEAEEAEPDLGDEPGELSWALAARVELGPAMKQELLELRSPRVRIVRLAELFARARVTLAWARTARERAAGNGRVEPPG